jgi:chromosome segregation ATPase
MAGEPQAQAITELLTWLEQQLRTTREEQVRQVAYLDQLRRQVHDLAEQIDAAERAIRDVEPRFAPFRGLPEKLNAIDQAMEDLRQAVSSLRAESTNQHRLFRAESEYDRQERGELLRRVDTAAHQLGLVLADVAQVQQQSSQVGQQLQALLERQREVEQHVHQFGLRLDRSIEVNRDLEERIKQVLLSDLDDRFEVVFERLQVVGEMVRRNEDVISTVAHERDFRQELIDEIAIWREEHHRIDNRLNQLEEVTDRLVTVIDKVQGEITLLEGRHSGLGERVATIRRDIAEVVDHVREEFAKFNTMYEKQRRKQIQVLEQELREMKFHAFRPPEEP